MPTAREIMTREAEWVDADATAIDVAKKFTSADLGALPICGGQGHLQGMVTDRDLVVKVLALGRDPEDGEGKRACRSARSGHDRRRRPRRGGHQHDEEVRRSAPAGHRR